MDERRAWATIGAFPAAAAAYAGGFLGAALAVDPAPIAARDAAGILGVVWVLALLALAALGAPLLGALGALRAMRWWTCALCGMGASLGLRLATLGGGSALDGGGFVAAAAGAGAGLVFWAVWRLGAPLSGRGSFWGPPGTIPMAKSEAWVGAAAALAMGLALCALRPPAWRGEDPKLVGALAGLRMALSRLPEADRNLARAGGARQVAAFKQGGALALPTSPPTPFEIEAVDSVSARVRLSATPAQCRALAKILAGPDAAGGARPWLSMSVGAPLRARGAGEGVAKLAAQCDAAPQAGVEIGLALR